MKHLTMQQVSDYGEGITSPEVESHIRTCQQCRAALRLQDRIENAFRRIPTEEVPDDFADRTLRRLGIRAHSPFAWNLLKNFAPVVALVLVGGAVFAVLYYTGVLGGTQEVGITTPAAQPHGSLSHQLSNGVSSFNRWINTYLSFAFAKNTYAMTAFVAGFFAAIALVDKFVLMPLMRKRIRGLR